MDIDKLLLGKNADGVSSSGGAGRRRQEIRIANSSPAAAATDTFVEAADEAELLDSGLTLWDLTSPEAMARVALDLFGDAAVTAAAWCALMARFDGCDADYRFWFTVFVKLGGVAGDRWQKLAAGRQ